MAPKPRMKLAMPKQDDGLPEDPVETIVDDVEDGFDAPPPISGLDRAEKIGVRSRQTGDLINVGSAGEALVQRLGAPARLDGEFSIWFREKKGEVQWLYVETPNDGILSGQTLITLGTSVGNDVRVADCGLFDGRDSGLLSELTFRTGAEIIDDGKTMRAGAKLDETQLVSRLLGMGFERSPVTARLRGR